VRQAGESAAPSVERAIELVAGAGMVAFGGVGFAGTVLPETTAFEVLTGLRIEGNVAAAARRAARQPSLLPAAIEGARRHPSRFTRREVRS